MKQIYIIGYFDCNYIRPRLVHIEAVFEDREKALAKLEQLNKELLDNSITTFKYSMATHLTADALVE